MLTLKILRFFPQIQLKLFHKLWCSVRLKCLRGQVCQQLQTSWPMSSLWWSQVENAQVMLGNIHVSMAKSWKTAEGWVDHGNLFMQDWASKEEPSRLRVSLASLPLANLPSWERSHIPHTTLCVYLSRWSSELPVGYVSWPGLLTGSHGGSMCNLRMGGFFHEVYNIVWYHQTIWTFNKPNGYLTILDNIN